jgi:hypothetical protein
MRTLLATLVLALAVLLAAGASAAPLHLHKYMENPQPVGSGDLRYLVWNVYTATLFAPSGAWSPDAPFALHIVYHMDIQGEDIASRSIEEMRRQGLDDPEAARRFEARMAAVFPDVTGGTTLTGIRERDGGTLFYRNGAFIGAVREREFTDRFFAIWLAPDTSEPRLRERLLGIR